MSTPHPVHRGLRYSRRDAAFQVISASGAELFVDIGDVSYTGAPLEEAYMIAEGQIAGRTRGDYGAIDVSMALSKQAAQRLFELLGADAEGGGYKDAIFSLVVTYSAPGLPTLVDTLLDCRVVSDEDSLTSGPEALMVTVGVRSLELERNGVRSSGGSLA